jgi:acyl-CoA thioesterase-1
MQSDMTSLLTPKYLRRRDAIQTALALTLLVLKPKCAMASSQGPKPTKVLVIGDSLSAEYGLQRGSGWVALLERRLRTERAGNTVVNASISGDTTSGGLSRLGALLAQHQPTLVLIELGGNDALRGLPLNMSQNNLLKMTRLAQAAGAKVLLLGMQMPPNYGRDYAEKFARMYSQIAKDTGAALLPFLLKGVADVPDSLKWFQADRIHPTAEAQAQILANVWPLLKKEIR